jgi:hypothetical protein
MKLSILAITLLMSFSALANSSCIDIRAAFFGDCGEGRTLVHVQGQCEASYEAESSYCAEIEAPDCLDLRAAFFAPCFPGTERVYVQGRCEKAYEVEHTYCAERE